MRGIWLRSCILGLAFFLPSCASYTDKIASINQAFRAREYQKALSELEASPLKEQDRNLLLYKLEKAMILDRMGNAAQARQLLLQSAELSDRLYRKSITGNVASFIYNDSTTDYAGEDYEKVAIHAMLAISFVGADQYSKAAIEARAINTTLTEINNFYDENKNRYSDDGFARLLSGLIFEAKGDWDNAIVQYRGAMKIYEAAYSKSFDTPVPRVLVSSLYGLAQKRGRSELARSLNQTYPKWTSPPVREQMGEVVVFHQVETINKKTTGEFIFLWDGKPMRFSFPVIKKKWKDIYGDTGVEVLGRYQSADLVQNFDAIASATLEDARLRYTAKMTARIILKDQIAQKAKKTFGPIGGLAAGIYNAITETADTRSWTSLPAALYISRIRIPANTSLSLKIKSGGKVVGYKSINVKPGQVILLRD